MHVTGFALERILPPTGVRGPSVGVGAVVAGARAGTGVVDPPLDDDLVAGLGHRPECTIGVAEPESIEARVHQLIS